MTPAEALARRAVAAPGWRWLPGMVDSDGDRFVAIYDGPTNKWPDLADPATLGCLLALVREAHDDPGIHCTYDGHSWWAENAGGTYLCAHPGAREKRQNGDRCCIGGPCHGPAAAETEGGALVLALEAAPVRR